MMNIKALTDRAVALHRSGNLADAERLYRAALAEAPEDFTARHLLGVVLAQQGRPDEGLAEVERALAMRPDDSEVHLNRANIHRMLGRLDEALAGFTRALAERPDWPQVLNNRGGVLQDLKRPAEALADFQRALQLAPGVSAVLNNMGGALVDLKRPAEALAAFDQALALAPNDAVVLCNRANALRLLNRNPEALADYTRSLALMPRYAKALSNRGGVLQHLKRHQAALADFEAALALDPDMAPAVIGAAMAARNLCDFARAEKYGALLVARARAAKTVAPWALLSATGDEALHLTCARHTIAERFPALPAPLADARYGHDRIRIGYLSSDYANHPVTQQVTRLIELHDRSRFEVLGFSTGPGDNSPERARIAAAFDAFHDVRGQSADETARSVRDLEVDILVDLNGHTEGDGFDILAFHPAPVQAAWLGYAGSSGAPFIDVCIADSVVAPDGAVFSERLARLPHCFFPTDNTRPIGAAPTRADMGLPESGFVFCSFNQNWKFGRQTYAIWMRLLVQVEGSVLWLKQPAEAADNLRAAAAAHGVDPARLVFAPHAPMEVHLARHALADLFLDTSPYNAHATAADALWAGLPVLTCLGTSYAGRVAASQLTALGLEDLIARSAEDYEALALTLARDPARLAALRAKLAAARATAPLFDTARFARDLEALYENLLSAAP